MDGWMVCKIPYEDIGGDGLKPLVSIEHSMKNA